MTGRLRAAGSLFAPLRRGCGCGCAGACYAPPAVHLTDGGKRPRVPKAWRRYGRWLHRRSEIATPGDLARDWMWQEFSGGCVCQVCGHCKAKE